MIEKGEKGTIGSVKTGGGGGGEGKVAAEHLVGQSGLLRTNQGRAPEGNQKNRGERTKPQDKIT